MIEWSLNIRETDMPQPLKTIIFRIVQDTLRSLIRETEADRIWIKLARENGNVQLSIKENAFSYRSTDNEDPTDNGIITALVLMRERTILSGGEFGSVVNKDGTVENIAHWPA